MIRGRFKPTSQIFKTYKIQIQKAPSLSCCTLQSAGISLGLPKFPVCGCASSTVSFCRGIRTCLILEIKSGHQGHLARFPPLSLSFVRVEWGCRDCCLQSRTVGSFTANATNDVICLAGDWLLEMPNVIRIFPFSWVSQTLIVRNGSYLLNFQTSSRILALRGLLARVRKISHGISNSPLNLESL